MKGIITLVVNGERREIEVPDIAAVSAERLNAAMADAGVVAGYEAPAAKVGPTPAEMRAALLKFVRRHDPAAIRSSLAAIGRKGWGLDGLGLPKLRELAVEIEGVDGDWEDE